MRLILIVEVPKAHIRQNKAMQNEDLQNLPEPTQCDKASCGSHPRFCHLAEQKLEPAEVRGQTHPLQLLCCMKSQGVHTVCQGNLFQLGGSRNGWLPFGFPSILRHAQLETNWESPAF